MNMISAVSEWLEEFGRVFIMYRPRLIASIITHLWYVLGAVGLGFVVAFVLAVLLSRKPKWASYVLPVISLFQTIPGIAFIGVLFIYNGMVPSTALIALAVYAVFPILKNSYVGIINVSESCKEAARGCGMSPLQVLINVELPLAVPSIIAGVRISVVYIVSWAVLAAAIGLGGLGELIYAGVASNNKMLILLGALPAAAMALILSAVVDWLRRVLVPRQLRRDAHES